MKKRILILGANRYNVMSIRAAREAGFFTLAADWESNAPGLAVADVGLPIDITHCDELVEAVAAHGGVDGIVTRAEVGVRAAAQMCHRLGLPTVSAEAAANATSKAAMRRLWKGLGKRSPQFSVVSSEQEALQAVGQLGSFPLIFKPDRSLGGSRGVSRIEDLQAVSEAFAFAQRGGLPESEVVIEACVTGSEHSAEVLIWEGQTSVLCIAEKVKSRPPYRVDVSVQYPASLTQAQEAEVAEMCDEAIKALGLTRGVAHVEFAWTNEGPVLFELGARCGGGLTPQLAYHVSGVNEFVETCRIACGLAPQSFRPTARRGADYRFVILPTGQLTDVQLPEKVRTHPAVLDAELTVRPGEQIHPLKTTSERAGFLAVVGEHRLAASQTADWACGQIVAKYADGQMKPASLTSLFAEKVDIEAEPVLSPADENYVVERYRQRIAKHGLELASLNSGSEEKQLLRCQVHHSAMRSHNPCILDIGCGLGSFLRYLEARNVPCRYTGYDIVPEYIAECRRLFPNARFELRNALTHGIDSQYDTIVLSQVLNNRYQDSDNVKVIRRMLKLAFAHARISVSVDMLSSYADRRNSEVFYYSPEEMFTFARTLTPRVLLRHDYRPFEFCLQLFHADVPGFIP
jgi:biotin carboxylase/SAM-dependent methyltransferase